MKNLILSGILLALIPGCVGIKGDPAVVNAERIAGIATDTVYSFLKFEETNREVINSIDVMLVAKNLSKNFPLYIDTLRSCTKAYKYNRTPENKVSLNTAISVVNAAMIEAQKYLIWYSKKEAERN